MILGGTFLYVVGIIESPSFVHTFVSCVDVIISFYRKLVFYVQDFVAAQSFYQCCLW